MPNVKFYRGRVRVEASSFELLGEKEVRKLISELNDMLWKLKGWEREQPKTTAGDKGICGEGSETPVV